MLGRKQKMSNEAWINAMQTIEQTVSEQEIRDKSYETADRIAAMTTGKRTAVSYSAGKDSIVLSDICRQAGITENVMVVTNLEYPAFMAWVNDHMPEGCEIVNTGQDLEWLKKHPNMLFPQSSREASQWFHIVQHRGQAMYYKQHSLDMIILGRRKADGNYVGKGTDIYTNGQGVTRYSPLADWRHEDILAYIHYNQLPLPPIYEWHNGFLCGTHPWPARQWTGSIESGWKEVYDIDPDIVREAAQYLESAGSILLSETEREVG